MTIFSISVRGIFIGILFPVFACILSAQTCHAQWHQLPGPPSGPVNDIVEIDSSNGRIYAATDNGVYRTIDTGRSWQLMGFANREVLKIIQYKISNQEILLAIARAGSPWILCRSADSAKNWDTVFTSTSAILEVLQDGNDIVIGVAGSSTDTTAGIFRSSNLGATWSHQAQGPPNPNVLTDFTLGGGNIFGIVNDSGILEMPAKGSAWQQTSYPYWHKPQSLKFVGADLFVGGIGHMDISTDNGTTWLAVPDNGLDTMRDNISSFAVNGLTIIATGAGIYRSTDGAASWENIEGTGGYPLSSYTGAIAFLDNQFFAGAYAGVLVSADGISWNYASDGLTGNVLDVISDDTILFALTDRGVFRSLDQGTTWIAPNGGSDLEDSLASSFYSVGGSVFATGSGGYGTGGLWRWNGSGWTTLTDIPVISIADDSGELYASLGTDGLVKSTDNGATWTDASNGLPYDTSSTDAVVALGGRILAFQSPFNGLPNSIIERVYASDDDGLSWSFLDTLRGKVFSASAAGNGIYAASYNGISRSTDNGEHWAFSPQIMRQLRPFGSGLIVTTSDSIYSIDNADVSIFSDSIAGPLDGFTNDKQFAYAATGSRGIWAAPLIDLPLGVRNTISPHTEIPLQVYPDPMENNATISFYLPDREDVSLRLYDERGVCRATLFEGAAGPGDVSIPVSLLLARGNYEARLQNNRGNSVTGIVIEGPHWR